LTSTRVIEEDLGLVQSRELASCRRDIEIGGTHYYSGFTWTLAIVNLSLKRKGIQLYVIVEKALFYPILNSARWLLVGQLPANRHRHRH
jgi:hypothetical protein